MKALRIPVFLVRVCLTRERRLDLLQRLLRSSYHWLRTSINSRSTSLSAAHDRKVPDIFNFLKAAYPRGQTHPPSTCTVVDHVCMYGCRQSTKPTQDATFAVYWWQSCRRQDDTTLAGPMKREEVKYNPAREHNLRFSSLLRGVWRYGYRPSYLTRLHSRILDLEHATPNPLSVRYDLSGCSDARNVNPLEYSSLNTVIDALIVSADLGGIYSIRGRFAPPEVCRITASHN